MSQILEQKAEDFINSGDFDNCEKFLDQIETYFDDYFVSISNGEKLYISVQLVRRIDSYVHGLMNDSGLNKSEIQGALDLVKKIEQKTVDRFKNAH